jgi:hypothetical protein
MQTEQLGMRSATLTIGILLVSTTTTRADEAQTARDEMQRALNKETMATPFNAGDIKKASVYAVEAKAQNVQPVLQPPSYWIPGWTCASMTASPYYTYLGYRNCIYYHHYHGRYWR